MKVLRDQNSNILSVKNSNLPGGMGFLPFSQLCLNPILLHALHILIHADLDNRINPCRADPLEAGHMGDTG